MQETIHCIIIDDEKEARDILGSLLGKFPEVKVLAQLSNVEEGISSFLKHRPELVFVDVQMPQKDGFEFVRLLEDLPIETRVVFVTAYQKYAIEAIKHSAFDYLLKPINQQELKNTIERFKNKKENPANNIQQLFHHLNHSKKLKLNTRTGFELVSTEKILFVEAARNYCQLNCITGKTLLATQNLGNMEELLPEDRFFRISRSHIINLDYLSNVDTKKKKCRLIANKTEVTLSISRDRLKELEERL